MNREKNTANHSDLFTRDLLNFDEHQENCSLDAIRAVRGKDGVTMFYIQPSSVDGSWHVVTSAKFHQRFKPRSEFPFGYIVISPAIPNFQHILCDRYDSELRFKEVNVVIAGGPGRTVLATESLVEALAGGVFYAGSQLVQDKVTARYAERAGNGGLKNIDDSYQPLLSELDHITAHCDASREERRRTGARITWSRR